MTTYLNMVADKAYLLSRALCPKMVRSQRLCVYASVGQSSFGVNMLNKYTSFRMNLDMKHTYISPMVVSFLIK